MSICVAGCLSVVSERLMILGVTLNSSLFFDNHVNEVFGAYYYHLRSLRYISVDEDITCKLACSITRSRIDYCNVLLYGISNKTIGRLQSSMTSAFGNYNSGLNSMALLRELHWLPIQSCIEFKVAT